MPTGSKISARPCGSKRKCLYIWQTKLYFQIDIQLYLYITRIWRINSNALSYKNPNLLREVSNFRKILTVWLIKEKNYLDISYRTSKPLNLLCNDGCRHRPGQRSSYWLWGSQSCPSRWWWHYPWFHKHLSASQDYYLPSFSENYKDFKHLN